MAKRRTRSKREVLEELVELFRISGSQDRNFDRSAAERLAINDTDLGCLDVVQRAGAMTAGELAREAGLTSGAVTAVIDRLERAGFARRVSDPSDRRRVLVEVTAKMHEDAGAIWEPLAADWRAVMERYTIDQLELIAGFMRASNEVAEKHIERVRSER